MNKNEIKALLTRLQKAHLFFVKSSNEVQGQLLKSCEYLFDKLEALGVPRDCSTTLLISGKEFLEFEFKEIIDEDENWARIAEEVFHASVPQPDNRPVAPIGKNGLPVKLWNTVEEPASKPVQQTFGGADDDIPF